MSKAISELFVELRASTAKFQSEMAKAAGTLQGFAKSFGDVGKQLSLGFSLPLAGIAVAVGRTGMEFEASMNNVRARTKATGQDFNDLQKLALDMGKATKFSAKEAADGMAVLAQAGANQKQIFDAIRPTLDLAAASNMSVAESADIAVGIMGAFGKEYSDFGHIADVLAFSADASAVSLQDIGYAMKYAGPVAHTAGIEMEELASQIIIMGNAGIKGETAGTSLRGAISRLIDPPKKAREALERLNIAVTDGKGKMLSLSVILGEMAQKFKTTGASGLQEMIAIFGREPAPGMMALINQLKKTPDVLADLADKAKNNTEGFVKQVADIMNSGGVGAFERMRGSIETFSDVMYTTFVGAASKVFTFIDNLAQKATDLAYAFNALPDTLKDVVFFLGLGAVTIGPLIVGIGLLGSAFGVIASIGIPAVLGSIVAGLAMFAATNETVQGAVVTAWDAIKEAFTAAFDYLADTSIGRSIGMIATFFSDNFGRVTDIVHALGVVLYALVDTIIVPLFQEIAPAAINALYNAFTVWGLIPAIIKLVGAAIEEFVYLATGGLTALLQFLTGDFSGAWTTLGGLVPKVVSDIYASVKDWLVDKLGGAFAFVGEKLAWLGNQFVAFYNAIPGTSKINEFATNLSSGVSDAVGVVGEGLQSYSDNISKAFSGAKDAISTPVVQGVAKASDAIAKYQKEVAAAIAAGYKAGDGKIGGDTGKPKGGKGSRGGKTDAEQWGDKIQKLDEQLTDVFDDVNKVIDPLREKIKTLIQAKDIEGLKALRAEVVTNEESARKFSDALKEAKQDITAADAASKKMADTQRGLFEKITKDFGTADEVLSPLAQHIADLGAEGNIQGIKDIAVAMSDNEEHTRDFSAALDDAAGHMKKLEQDSEAMGSAIAGAFEKLGSKLGLASDSTKTLSELLGGLFSGSGKSGSVAGVGAGISNAITSTLGNLFGSSSGSGGSSIVSSITSLFGGGGGTSGIGPVADGGEYASALSGATSSLSQFSAGINALSSVFSAHGIDKKNKDNSGTGAAVGGVAGAYWGPVGSAIGSAVGGAIGKLFKWGSQNPETQARHAFSNFIESTFEKLGTVAFADAKGKLQVFNAKSLNFLEGDSKRFGIGGDVGGTNWGDNFAKMGEQVKGTFIGLGQAFKSFLGLADANAGQLGYLLATNLNGNLDNARLLVAQLGVSMDDMLAAVLKSATQGTISWAEYNQSVAAVNDAFKEGVVAQGAYGQAFDNLINSGGRGMAAVKSFKDIAVEAMEAGVKTMDELKAKLIAGGANPEYVNALFQAAADQGIKTLEQMAHASTETAGAAVGNLQGLSAGLNKQWSEMKGTLDDIQKTIAGIPDKVEKSVHIGVTVDDPDGALNKLSDTPSSSAASSTTTAASTSKQRSYSTNVDMSQMNMNNADPKAKNARSLRSANLSERAKSQPNITLVVQGGEPGLEEKVHRVVRDLTPEYVNQAVSTAFDSMRRE